MSSSQALTITFMNAHVCSISFMCKKILFTYQGNHMLGIFWHDNDSKVPNMILEKSQKDSKAPPSVCSNCIRCGRGESCFNTFSNIIVMHSLHTIFPCTLCPIFVFYMDPSPNFTPCHRIYTLSPRENSKEPFSPIK